MSQNATAGPKCRPEAASSRLIISSVTQQMPGFHGKRIYCPAVPRKHVEQAEL